VSNDASFALLIENGAVSESALQKKPAKPAPFGAVFKEGGLNLAGR